MRAVKIHNGISGTFMSTILKDFLWRDDFGVAYSEDLIDFSKASNIVKHQLLSVLSTWPLAKNEAIYARLLNYVKRGHNYSHGIIITSLIATRDGHSWKFVIGYKDKISTIANNWRDDDIASSNEFITIVRARPQFLELKSSELSVVGDMLRCCEERALPLNFGENLPTMSSFNQHNMSIDTDYGVYSINCKVILLNNEASHPDVTRLLFTLAIRDAQISFTAHSGKSIQCKIYGVHHARGTYRQNHFATSTESTQREHVECFLATALAAIHSFDADNITGMVCENESHHAKLINENAERDE